MTNRKGVGPWITFYSLDVEIPRLFLFSNGTIRQIWLSWELLVTSNLPVQGFFRRLCVLGAVGFFGVVLYIGSGGFNRSVNY